MTNSREYNESVALFDWVLWNERNYPSLKYFHSIPNGAYMVGEMRNGKHFSPVAMKMKRSGLRPGIPDYFLPWPNGKFSGLYLEMKTGDNNPDSDQLEFLIAAECAGFKSAVAWDSDAAIAVLERYLNGADLDGMFFGLSARRVKNQENIVNLLRSEMLHSG